MGNSSQVNPIKVFCFGNKDKILEGIFPEPDENIIDKWEHRKLNKFQSIQENETKKKIKIQIEWKATLYPDITDENINELFEDLGKKMDIPKEEYDDEHKIENYNDSKIREKCKNIIIKFGKNNSNYLINYMNDIPKTHLPQIAIITSEDFDEGHEGLEDNRYLTIIKTCTEENIYDYLWEKECYYNERGTIFLNDNKDKIETNNYINIILTGLSRSGKSTLINVLSQKLVTLESPFLESVTNNIREYKVYTSKNEIFKTGLRFFDTPGLTVIENQRRNTIEEVKTLIDKKLKECKDARDDIHLIYFMLKSIPNLENYVNFFKYIIDLNRERMQKGKKKIYIIFIFNGSYKEIEQSMIEYLKENHLEELIEYFNGSKPENNKNYKELYKNKIKINKSKKIKYNIIRVNLIKDEESNQQVFGIDSLLKITLDLLKKDNPFDDEDFKQLEIYKQQLVENPNVFINNMHKNAFEENVNLIYKKISSKNSFLSNIQSIQDIQQKAAKDNQFSLYRYIFLRIFKKYTDGNIETEGYSFSEYLKLFEDIAKNYKLFIGDVELLPIIDFENKTKELLVLFTQEIYNDKNIKFDGIKHFNINNITGYNGDLKVDPSNLTINGELISKQLSFKSIIIGWLADYYTPFVYFTEKIQKIFENYLQNTCCIKYILKQKEFYKNIFKQIEDMQNKIDWGDFKAQIFK